MSGVSVVAMGTVAVLPMMLDQIVDSCHSLVPSGLHGAPVTLWPGQATYHSSVLRLLTSVKVLV